MGLLDFYYLLTKWFPEISVSIPLPPARVSVSDQGPLPGLEVEDSSSMLQLPPSILAR